MAEERTYMRQLGVLPYAELRKTRVTLIGAGAIGGFTALALAKMGVGFLEVWDFDTVEEHNLPNQWYRREDIGKPKVACLKANLEGCSDVNVVVHAEAYKKQRLQPIVITAVDSMDVRLTLWEVIRDNTKVLFLIDGRMGAQLGRVLVVDKANAAVVENYVKEELYPSSEAFQAPCTERSTVYCAAGLSSYIASAVGKIVASQPVKPTLSVDFFNWEVAP